MVFKNSSQNFENSSKMFFRIKIAFHLAYLFYVFKKLLKIIYIYIYWLIFIIFYIYINIF